MKFTSACMKFFGKKKDQSLADFVAEVKKLTANDKADLNPLLEKALGEKIEWLVDEPLQKD